MRQYLLPAIALLLIGGCAKTWVVERQSYEGPRLARPARILVYDFAASAADLPPGGRTTENGLYVDYPPSARDRVGELRSTDPLPALLAELGAQLIRRTAA